MERMKRWDRINRRDGIEWRDGPIHARKYSSSPDILSTSEIDIFYYIKFMSCLDIDTTLFGGTTTTISRERVSE